MTAKVIIERGKVRILLSAENGFEEGIIEEMDNTEYSSRSVTISTEYEDSFQSEKKIKISLNKK